MMGRQKAETRRQVNWLIDRPIAHRGLHNIARGIPENSLSAFDAAIRAALPIEFDVRLTEDQQAIVFHDGNLQRLTGVNRQVASTSLREIQRLPIAGTDERPPSLEEALEFIDGRVPVLIEVKASRPPGELEGTVFKAIRDYNGLAAVQSFSPKSMRWFRENAPGVIRGQISGTYRLHDLPSWHRFFHRHLLMLQNQPPGFRLSSCRLPRLASIAAVASPWRSASGVDGALGQRSRPRARTRRRSDLRGLRSAADRHGRQGRRG